MELAILAFSNLQFRSMHDQPSSPLRDRGRGHRRRHHVHHVGWMQRRMC